MSLVVTAVKGAARGKKLRLDRLNVLRVGRAPQNDLVIDEPEISRFHCFFKRNEDGWAVFDMGGVNGTVVGGRRVKERALKEGDLISVGRTVLLFGMPKPPKSKAPTLPIASADAQVKPVVVVREPPPSAAAPVAEKGPPKTSTTVAVAGGKQPGPDDMVLVPEDEVRPMAQADGAGASSPPQAEAPAATEVMPAMFVREDGQSDSDLVIPQEAGAPGLLERLGGLLRKKPKAKP